jgi:hypothetical protein
VKKLDCSSLESEYFRQICRGEVAHLSPEQAEEYRQHWANYPPGSKIPYGLGDLVEWLIRKATFGRLRPWTGCNCQARKAKLNKIQLWPLPVAGRLIQYLADFLYRRPLQPPGPAPDSERGDGRDHSDDNVPQQAAN